MGIQNCTLFNNSLCCYKGYVTFKNFEIGVGDRLAEIEEIADFEKREKLLVL